MHMHGRTILAGSAVALSLMGTMAVPSMAHGMDGHAVAHVAERAGAPDLATPLAMTSQKLYVQTGVAMGGDGSRAQPFASFEHAYAVARDGDTIVCLNAVTIVDADDGKTDGAFALDKNLTVVGDGAAAALSSREALLLSSDLALENIEFFAPTISLHGHALSLKNVKNFTANQMRPTVYGGKAAGLQGRFGAKSSLTVAGAAGDPFVFEDIYAGNEAEESSIPVRIQLQVGAKVRGVLSADGAADDAPVQADVEMLVGNANVASFINEQAGARGTTLELWDFDGTSGVEVIGFSKVALTNTRLAVKRQDGFSANQDVELDARSALLLGELADPIAIEGGLNAAPGSRVELSQTGLLDIKGAFAGSFELRTPGAAVDTSGIVKNGHTYVQAAFNSTGIVDFTPFTTQARYVLTTENEGPVRRWVARKPPAQIDSVAFEANPRLAIAPGEQELPLVVKGAHGADVEHAPIFYVDVRTQDGAPVDPDTQLAFWQYADTPSVMRAEVLDTSLEPGMYRVTLTDIVTRMTYDATIELYRPATPVDPGATDPNAGGTDVEVPGPGTPGTDGKDPDAGRPGTGDAEGEAPGSGDSQVDLPGSHKPGEDGPTMGQPGTAPGDAGASGPHDGAVEHGSSHGGSTDASAPMGPSASGAPREHGGASSVSTSDAEHAAVSAKAQAQVKAALPATGDPVSLGMVASLCAFGAAALIAAFRRRR